MEVAADSKVARPGSTSNDGTRCARGESNSVANLGAKKTGNELDRGERKPPAPRLVPTRFEQDTTMVFVEVEADGDGREAQRGGEGPMVQ
jgi:hypothetical protein